MRRDLGHTMRTKERGTYAEQYIERCTAFLRVELSRFLIRIQSTLRSLVSNFGKSGKKVTWLMCNAHDFLVCVEAISNLS